MLGGRGNTHVAHKPLYSFPELKVNEILQCLDDLKIQINENDLLKPNSSTVLRIYETFADIFMGFNKDKLSNKYTNQVLESLEFPDLHLDSIALVSFFRVIQKLMNEVGIDDFSIRDVIRPETARLKIILSAIINFAKFREEQLSVFEEFNRRSDEAINLRATLSKRFEDISKKTESILEKRRTEDALVKTARDESTKYIQTLKDLKKEQALLSSTLEQLKAEKNELSNRLAQLQFISGNIKQECNKLKSRIVHSPDKLIQIIGEMNQSIVTEKQTIGQIEKKSREIQTKYDCLAQLEQEITKCFESLESLKRDTYIKEELLHKVRSERELIESQNMIFKDLMVKEQRMSRHLNSAHDKLNRLQAQQKEKREKLKIRLESLNSEYCHMSEERKNYAFVSEKNELSVKELESKISEIRRSHDLDIASIRQESVNLRAKVESYLSELQKAL